MIRIDANILIRLIIRDNQEMVDIAQRKVLAENCYVSNEVVAEVVYVLTKVYKIERQTVSNTIIQWLALLETENESVIIEAIKIFSETKLDFVDCILAAYKYLDDDEIFTFDKKLNNYIKQRE